MGLAGCGPSLPDPESPGAVILARRCGECHRVYAPRSMTIAMWEVQLEMHRRTRYAKAGAPWLTPHEERVLREYLAAHAGTN